MSLIITCSRCGQPLPEIPDDLQSAVLAGRAQVPTTHPEGQCPTGLAPDAARAPVQAPTGRVFEATMIVREVFPHDEGPGVREPEVLAEFTSSRIGETAADVLEPGGPLARDFGAKWQRMHEHIGIADMPIASVNNPPFSPTRERPALEFTDGVDLSTLQFKEAGQGLGGAS